jgi:hypothetical protein
MSEFEINGPDDIALAIDKVGFTKKEKALVFEYIGKLVLKAYTVTFEGGREGEELNMKELKAYADEQCPEGAALVKRLLNDSLMVRDNPIV